MRRLTSLLLSTLLAALLGATLATAHAVDFAYGDRVRLNTSETLLFQGANLAPATKGQEFSVLKHDARQNLVYVGYLKPDASLVAATLPASALEPAPANAWSDLLRGVEAFGEGRLDLARKLLQQVGPEPQQFKAIATALLPRLGGLQAAAGQGAAGQATVGSLATNLRQMALQLNVAGYYSLAAPLEEGIDKFAPVPTAEAPRPAGALTRTELREHATASGQAMLRCRQAIALHRLVEATPILTAGLAAEPKRPDLIAFQARIAKDLAEADSNYENAEKMRRFIGGTPHALTALEHGLKACTDHVKLRALRQEMQGMVEERTSPQLTAAFVALAKVSAPPTADEGRKLYTTRCTECHDLEALDSRSISGWERAVGSMSGRAHLNEAQRSRIMEYLTVAWNGVSNSSK